MKSSSSSSATGSIRPPVQPPRRGFALTGPSVTLDPSTHAVRRDLADVRLAEYVFAPHYAAAVTYRLMRDAPLRERREADAPVAADLTAGEAFEVLDLVAGQAWGIAPGPGRVGWLDRAALGGKA